MKATAADIKFAHIIECALRDSIQLEAGGDDLYQMLLNAERRRSADLYRDCCEHMKATGEWRMPTQAELDDAKDAAWAPLTRS